MNHQSLLYSTYVCIDFQGMRTVFSEYRLSYRTNTTNISVYNFSTGGLINPFSIINETICDVSKECSVNHKGSQSETTFISVVDTLQDVLRMMLQKLSVLDIANFRIGRVGAGPYDRENCIQALSPDALTPLL